MSLETAVPTKKPTRKPAKKVQEPRRTLAEIGREARVAAQKKELLETLVRLDWSLSATATELGLTNASNVVRAIRELKLDAEYEAAIAAGKIRRGIR